MIPIDFCASFEPCENAIMHAETSCIRRERVFTSGGVTRRNAHIKNTIRKNATMNPSVGETTSGTITFSPSAFHLNAEKPACATTAPASPPISACDELEGMP